MYESEWDWFTGHPGPGEPGIRTICIRWHAEADVRERQVKERNVDMTANNTSGRVEAEARGRI
jgi:hypothetical protein